MYGIVGSMGRGYQVLGIDEVLRMLQNIAGSKRIEMVYVDTLFSIYLVSLYTEIATVVSCDDPVSDAPPLSGSVELLVQISFVPERVDADGPRKLEVLESFFECLQFHEFGVCSDHSSDPPSYR